MSDNYAGCDESGTYTGGYPGGVPDEPLAPSEAGGREEARDHNDRIALESVPSLSVEELRVLMRKAIVDLRKRDDEIAELRARLASRPSGEDSARAEVEAERDRLAKQCDQWEEDNRVLAFNARRQLQAVQQEVERIKALKPDYTAPEEYHRAVREKAADILAAIARASEGSPS